MRDDDEKRPGLPHGRRRLSPPIVAAPATRKVLVEVAVDSMVGAIAAAAAGADRVELCSALELGGLTPSLGLLRMVKQTVAIPVMAMLRPRRGDFLYRPDEFAVMQQDLRLLRDAGADGIVTGVLLADGGLDRERMATLVAEAGDTPVTCHRAFDLTADPHVVLRELRELGVARVLTSGQQGAAPLGTALLAELVRRSGDAPVVMAGAGIRDDNVAQLVAATGVREVHLSATRREPSGMRHHRPEVAMATGPALADDELRATDGAVVARVVAALRAGDRAGG